MLYILYIIYHIFYTYMYYIYIFTFPILTMMYLFILDYTDCVSIFAMPFHMPENPMELFKENASIESNHVQPALKC